MIYLIDMSSLSPTARVILGMLRLGARTGYEIKQKIEISTRFFWGASYGQIYPELKRLEEAALVESEDDPRGRVKRRAYRLTPAGEEALREWLADPDAGMFEMRDEALLKFFFGDLLTREEILANLRARRERMEHILGLFREIDEMTVEGWQGLRYPTRALGYGIGLVEWMLAWYEQAERDLSSG